jgi:hypothetical protein
LLGVHSRYGLHTRAVTVFRDTLSEGFSHFVTSIAAPVASGWSGCRVGLAPTGKRRLSTAHGRSGHFADIVNVSRLTRRRLSRPPIIALREARRTLRPTSKSPPSFARTVAHRRMDRRCSWPTGPITSLAAMQTAMLVGLNRIESGLQQVGNRSQPPLLRQDAHAILARRDSCAHEKSLHERAPGGPFTG